MAEGVPHFPSPLLKNDAVFLYGATRPLPYVHVYLPHRAEVVHGPACDVEREVRLQACRQDAVPVYRRRGGGGTVLLATGMVVTMVVLPRWQGATTHGLFSCIHTAMIRVLQSCGPADARIEERGLSDLAINEKKICGSSMYLGSAPRLAYYQSSLLVDCDTTLFEHYLDDVPRQPDYRLGRDHRAFCTTLKNQGWSCDAPSVARLLGQQLRQELLQHCPI